MYDGRFSDARRAQLLPQRVLRPDAGGVFQTSELAADLRAARPRADDPSTWPRCSGAYAGRLGIDTGTRNYHILSGDDRRLACGQRHAGKRNRAITPNISHAPLPARTATPATPRADYMDVALPIEGGSTRTTSYTSWITSATMQQPEQPAAAHHRRSDGRRPRHIRAFSACCWPRP